MCTGYGAMSDDVAPTPALLLRGHASALDRADANLNLTVYRNLNVLQATANILDQLAQLGAMLSTASVEIVSLPEGETLANQAGDSNTSNPPERRRVELTPAGRVTLALMGR